MQNCLSCTNRMLPRTGEPLLIDWICPLLPERRFLIYCRETPTHTRTCTNEASKISNLGCTNCTCIWQDQSLEQEDVSQRKHSTCNPARTVMATVDYTGRITRVYAISAAIELDNSVRLLLCHAAVPGMGRGFRVGAVVELRCVCKDSWWGGRCKAKRLDSWEWVKWGGTWAVLSFTFLYLRLRFDYVRLHLESSCY